VMVLKKKTVRSSETLTGQPILHNITTSEQDQCNGEVITCCIFPCMCCRLLNG
jgi:hypothetical protein